MNNNFIITITEEQANCLQKLGAEVDSKIFIIDRLFAIHSNDQDIQLFESIPFKHYMKDYEETYNQWELAKNQFEKTVLLPIVQEKTGKKTPNFTWSIDDFASLQCNITLL